MGVRKGGRTHVQAARDRWHHFAWLVLIGLIMFHAVNNYIVLKQDNVVLFDKPGILFQRGVEIQNKLPGMTLLGRIQVIYFESHWQQQQFFTAFYPPLFMGLSTLAMALLGISRNVAIMSNIPFVAVLLISTYYLGKELFNKETGLTAAILISFFPTIISFSRIFRPDYMFTALVTLSILCLVRTRRMSLHRECMLFGAALGLTALTKPSFVLFLVGPALTLGGIPTIQHLKAKEFGKFKRILFNIALATLIAVLIAGPWYATYSRDYLSTQRENFPVSPLSLTFKGKGFISDFMEFHPGRILGYSMLIPWAGMFGLAFVYFLLKLKKHRAFLLSWVLLPYLFFINLDFAWLMRLLRHLLPTLPAVALILAVALWESLKMMSKRFQHLRHLDILLPLGLLVIEIALFLIFTYAGSGDLRRPFGEELVGTKRMFFSNELGKLSPYQTTFDMGEVSGLLEREWSNWNQPSEVFVFYPQGMISESILSTMRARLRRAPFTERSCYYAWRGEADADTTPCEEAFASSDYAIIEGIRYDETVFPSEDETYSQKIAPFSQHITDGLANHTVLLMLSPRHDYTNPHDVHHPCFDWLNESVWILKRNW